MGTDLMMKFASSRFPVRPQKLRRNTCTGISSPNTSLRQVLQPLCPRTSRLPARRQPPWLGTRLGQKLPTLLAALLRESMLRLTKRSDHEISNKSLVYELEYTSAFKY